MRHRALRGGRLTLQRVVFDHASADYSGGAIFAALMPEPIVVEDSVFVSNEAGRLGGRLKRAPPAHWSVQRR